MSPEEIHEMQVRSERELARLCLREQSREEDDAQALMRLRHQVSGSTYYRELKIPKSSEGVRVFLRAMPVMTRELMKQKWMELPALGELESKAGKFIKVVSSGTTGEPVTVIKDDYDCFHMWTVLKFWFEALGLSRPKSTNCLLLDTLPNQLERSSSIPLLENGRLERINVRLERAVERIEAFSPDVVFTDPSGLQWLIENRLAIKPQLLLSSAQFLPLTLLNQVRDAFQAPVLDYYATTETGPVAWRCPVEPSNWHVLESEHWVDVEAGHVLVTRKRASLFPIVKYRTGDTADLHSEPCRCGRSGSSLKNLKGREMCLFVRADGSSIDAWSLSPHLKYRIQERFQLQQITPNKFRVLIESQEKSEAVEPIVREALAQNGWAAPEIEFQTLSAVEAAQEKFKPFVTSVS